MPLRSAGRDVTPFERGVVAAAALVVVAVVATIATVNRRALAPLAAADETILYYVEPPTAAGLRRAADDQLAEWAFADWARASRGRLSFRRTDDRSAARIRIGWEATARGRYGQTRPIMVGGRRGAAIAVHPDVAALGPGAAARGARDPLFLDVLVYLTCLHEIGHALGLTHTADSGDIMYFFGNGGNVPAFFSRYRGRVTRRGDIRRQTGLSAGDIDRLVAISR